MATVKNKLPTFGTNADIDENIVNNSSGLKNTGFQPNTTIKSAEMNTYMKMLINGMSGLIDSVYNDGVTQNEIKADSTSEDVKNYIVAGLNQIIKTNKVDNATHADKSTNVDAITNNDSGNNANVNFAIGNKSFIKTVNNVAHATNAEKLDSSAGSATQPVYFNGGKPVAITGNIANGTTGNAASSTKLQTARTFNVSGDATGTAQSFDGTGNVTIPVDVKKSAALDSINVGDATHPVYFNAEGKPARIDKVANATNADNASKLSTARNITLSGDASGSTSFDGSGNATINVSVANSTASKTVVDSKGVPFNVGDANMPVFFGNGIPKSIDYMFASDIVFDTDDSNMGPALQDVFDVPNQGSAIVKKAAALTDTSGIGLSVGSLGAPTYFSNGKPAKLTRTFFNELANQFKQATLTNGYIELSSVGITATTHTIEVIYNAGSASVPKNWQVSFGVISNTRLYPDTNDAMKLGIDKDGNLMRATDTGGRLYIEIATSIGGNGVVSFTKASGTVYVRDLTSYK